MPLLPDTGLLDLVYETALAGRETLSFTVRADDPKADFLFVDAELQWRNRAFYVAELIHRRGADGAAYVDISAEATWNRLADATYIGSFILFAYTAAEGLAAILADTGWTPLELPADVDAVTTYYLEQNDATYLDLLRRWAKITGNELQFNSAAKTVRLVTTIGTDRGIGFRYRKNVTSIVRRSTPPAATRLYVFGRNGIDITGYTVGGVPYLEDYSFYESLGLTTEEAAALYRRDIFYSDSTFTSDADLFAAATTYLARLAQPATTYELSVVDLSALTGLPEDTYEVGDTVRVADDVFGFDVSTRVVKIQQWPLDPSRGQIELSYLFTTSPPGGDEVSDARTNSTLEWTLLESRNGLAALQVRDTSQILHRLQLTTIPEARWVLGYSVEGIGVGTGNVLIYLIDTLTDEELYPPLTVAVADTIPFRASFTFGENHLAGRPQSLTIRAYSDSPSCGVDIPLLGSNMWILARGAIEKVIRTGNSIQYDGDAQTESLFHFTVPSSITEVRITAQGAAGAKAFGSIRGGYGARVTAVFTVTPGSILDVYAGGHGGDNSSGHGGRYVAGWPNGGNGGIISTRGGGGGGASYVTTDGGTLLDALIVAGGGGGSGAKDGGIAVMGGDAGFYVGVTGGTGSYGSGGEGGTRTAGGAGGIGTLPVDVGEAGDVDGQGYGGDAVYAGDIGVGGLGAGGGGGGWHGGGAGGGQQAGGGGGSSYIDTIRGYDVNTSVEPSQDDAADGYVIIEWDFVP